MKTLCLQVAAHLATLQRQLEMPREMVYEESGRLDSMIGPTPGMPPLKVTSLTTNPVSYLYLPYIITSYQLCTLQYVHYMIPRCVLFIILTRVWR